MRVLKVHNLIADVVGSLYKINQWVAHIAQWFSFFGKTNNAHFIGNFLIGGLFALEESELTLLAGSRRGKGILYNASDGGIAHDEATRATAFELVRQQAEGIGVSLKVSDIVPEGG